MRNGSEQQNGNTQLNNERNEFNKRVSSKLFMGKAKRVSWSDKRRFRTI